MDEHGFPSMRAARASNRQADSYFSGRGDWKRDSVTIQCLRGDSAVSKRDKGSPCHASKRDKTGNSFPSRGQIRRTAVPRPCLLRFSDFRAVPRRDGWYGPGNGFEHMFAALGTVVRLRKKEAEPKG